MLCGEGVGGAGSGVMLGHVDSICQVSKAPVLRYNWFYMVQPSLVFD